MDPTFPNRGRSDLHVATLLACSAMLATAVDR